MPDDKRTVDNQNHEQEEKKKKQADAAVLAGAYQKVTAQPTNLVVPAEKMNDDLVCENK